MTWYWWIDIWHPASNAQDKAYLALHGGDSVSQYSIYVEAYNDGDTSALMEGSMPRPGYATCEELVKELPGFVDSATLTGRAALAAAALSAMATSLVLLVGLN